tara:strand:+ start:4972 stop:6030 length:1059 start_codon:yes stop_codon:yes gene_type:complete
MTWRRNPRTITKEHFSDGTTIDGNRIDDALDDVVGRVNDIPYGDLRKRWVPITYVAGWTPQSPSTLEHAHDTAKSDAGEVGATHHWPWMPVRNTGGVTAASDQVVAGTTGATAGDDITITNPYRLKGAQCPGVYPYGLARPAGTSYTEASSASPFGEQYAWTRSWFLERPSILDSIDLILETDHTDAALDAADKVYTNDFDYGDLAADGYAGGSDDRGLVITASVDNVFDVEDRNLSDVEILRKGFKINNDELSAQQISYKHGVSPTYTDFDPKVQESGAGASTVHGIRIRLDRLNIPIHQNARLRVAVLIPLYDTTMRTNSGWTPNTTYPYPWLQQKVHMTVTMLEEVTGG